MGAGRLRVFLLWLADLACVLIVWTLVLWGYRLSGFGSFPNGLSFYWRMWPVGVCFTVLNVFFRLYHGNVLYPGAPLAPVEEMRRLFGSALITHFTALAVLALARQTTEDYSRFVIVASGVLTAVFAQLARDVVRRILFRCGCAQIPVALVGSGTVSTRMEEQFAQDAYTGFRVACVFADEDRDMLARCRSAGVKVLVACQDERVLRCRLEEYTGWFSHVEYVPTTAAFPVAGAQVVSFDAMGGLEMVNQRRMGALRREKWLLDKTLAVIAFLLLLPFFVVVPILVKITSRGPVFYRQCRLGKNGEKIRVWKFRSMYVDADARLRAILDGDPAKKAEWKANFKLADDPRVTPLGRLLRRTSIDEFPQLFNVFAGDMALVGPRPIVEEEVPLYGEAYEIFSSVLPGVTGLWQASGRSSTDYARRVKLDVYYVLNWSPWLDIWILFRTVSAVVFMRGAC